MGDQNADHERTPGSGPVPSQAQTHSDAFDTGAAYHSQSNYFSQSFPQSYGNDSSYGQRSMDMGSLRTALPQLSQGHMNAPNQFDMLNGFAYPSSHRGRPIPQYPMDSMRSQQHQYLAPQYSSVPSQVPMISRQAMQNQPHGQYQQIDPYTFGIPMTGFDPRMAHAQPYGMAPQMAGDHGQYGRRGSEPGPIPSYPRGPPRKPKQSGHALWVGNLPPNANVTDLKDHFSRDATKDIESLFLISKSNCAFVNYRTEQACNLAMNRFHDSRFHGVRLVCRLRRGSTSNASASQSLSPGILGTPPSHHSSASSIATSTAEHGDSSSSVAPSTTEHHDSASSITPSVTEESSSPTIVGGGQTSASPTAKEDHASTTDNRVQKVPEKFFIVKSLTAQDLEASVRNGIWATQSHNEKALNEAYENADNVYLIFSANKSGEYFGYARMASIIAGEPVNLSSTFSQTEIPSSGTPHSITTPATTTAPKGRIIDDSARGTIFWEADRSDSEEEGSPVKGEGEGEVEGNQNWGRQFAIEWVSTARLPFYRTRGLRNPWNSNREIKIARDGTELEPSVGRRVIQMFHRPAPSPGASQNPGMY